MEDNSDIMPARPIDRNTKRHFYGFDKFTEELKAKRKQPVEPNPPKTFYQKTLNKYEFDEGLKQDSISWDFWALDKGYITHEEYDKRKKNAR